MKDIPDTMGILFRFLWRFRLTLALIVIVIMLSGCAMLDKLRGGINPHGDMLIIPPDVTSEDVRG